MGLTARDHAFFIRAGAVPPWPSPFILANDERLTVGRCPCVPPDAPIGDRLNLLAAIAMDEAMMPMLEMRGQSRTRFFTCTSAPRPGLTREDIERPERGLVAHSPGARAPTRFGAASVFEALREAEDVLKRGDVQAV